MKMMTIKERVFGKEEVVVGGDQLYSRSLPALRRRGMGGLPLGELCWVCPLQSSSSYALVTLKYIHMTDHFQGITEVTKKVSLLVDQVN